jgi:catechol 2,3-dioxygenase-like lactoylglutathione lyase family enzyme
MTTKTAPKFGFALEYVKDIAEARRFYTDVLGLAVAREHPNYVEFENFAIATDESMSGKDEPELYWLVDDAQAAYDTMSSRAKVSTALQDMPFGRLFAVEDPAGRPRYVLELAKVRPSQAV